MNNTRQLIERRRSVVARGIGIFAGEISADSGAGSTLTDLDGNTYLDFAGGIGVMNAGHGVPSVVAAIQQQAAKLLHTCIHVASYEPYIALCEKLTGLLPHGEQTKAMLVNSGAEAVENAVKIARQATGRPAVLCFSEAFHGRTLLGMSLTSKTGYKLGSGPFAPEIYRIPYPNRFRRGGTLSEDAFVKQELALLRDAFVTTVAADQVAAVIIEVVQGEGGFVAAPANYLQGLRSICDEHGILLIADEVQSGFCRTGTWAAYEHAGITPDISTWAKSMGGGLPIGAVLGRGEVMDAAQPGTIGGTYGGNPVACAGSLATINYMQAHNLNARGAEIGRVIRSAFLELQETCPLVADVRGLGAMVGMELCHDRDPQKPAGAVAKAALSYARVDGVLALTAGPYGNVVRVLSPLTITDDELERGLGILCDSVKRAARESK